MVVVGSWHVVRDQEQRSHPLGMSEGELECRGGAGGNADDRRAGDAEQVQQRGKGISLQGG